MNRPVLRLILLIIAALSFASVQARADDQLLEEAREAMRKAGLYWGSKVQSYGGYVWEYSTDLTSRRRGESTSTDHPKHVIWVQPPGTPTVGMAFVRAYEATGEQLYLTAATRAAKCLERGQLKSGGWSYSIDFNAKTNRNYYHYLSKTRAKRLKATKNVTTFDDNNTQSATRLVMAVDRHVNQPWLTRARHRALGAFLKAQYKGGKWDGAWPQRYPQKMPKQKRTMADKKAYARLPYGHFPTFNDSTMTDCVKTMVEAYRQYRRPLYLRSVKRCLAFYLRAQLPDPQGAWAQQYDESLRPAWARRFEPPAVSGGESAGNACLMLDMYIEFGDERYLKSAARAVDWYKRSAISGAGRKRRWARFHELGTNKPLYFTRTYQLVYTDGDLPIHYSFKGGYGNRAIRYYEQVKKRGRQYYLDQRKAKKAPKQWAATARRMRRKVKSTIAALDDQGRWVKRHTVGNKKRDALGRWGYVAEDRPRDMLYSRTFCRNMNTLAEYIIAAQGGPKAKLKPKPKKAHTEQKAKPRIHKDASGNPIFVR